MSLWTSSRGRPTTAMHASFFAHNEPGAGRFSRVTTLEQAEEDKKDDDAGAPLSAIPPFQYNAG